MSSLSLLNQLVFLAQTSEVEQPLSDNLLTDITFGKVAQAATTVAIAYGSFWMIQVATEWLSERVPRRFRLTIKQALPFWKASILIVTLSYLLNLFLNLSEANLLALTGTIAVALGFAFKDYASSVIAGLLALFEAPYRMGDRIQIADHYGEVVGYGLRGIKIQTPDDNVVTIPHNTTWTEPISNANTGQLEAQVATSFYFAHHADAEKIVSILYQAAYSSKYTQLKLPIVVVMEEHYWGTQFKLRCYPMDARDEFVYKTDLIRRAKQAFQRHKLPYPEFMRIVNEEGMGGELLR
ncbi:MscS Mechanosensitive ion channel [[Leptolyngbya] sp. PCC 7376]|uniref:mechanosensitive ion channel family protein n=1 Tax=[Leptolyngbya] sp. PCC 7376 TaxID=111781 RepID=UPI00029F0FE6|nr:mechanosensitive ion channel family protein [[Leptolyngbya] sp. PCC 7376]AFY37571.1 MscS Mechanosensitive ion channel [[Leptolyngbya] sp. PCC 7376]